MAGLPCVMARLLCVMAGLFRVKAELLCVKAELLCVKAELFRVMAGLGPAIHDFVLPSTLRLLCGVVSAISPPRAASWPGQARP
jgi:hypothetical protein